jgi:NAD(P)H-flavin reductase/ferredoxin
MASILYDDEHIQVNEGQTVLSALLDRGHAIPNSCRAGACQSCLMQAVEGDVPSDAQSGLKETLKAQGYFMACRCIPHTSLKVVLPEPDLRRTWATVVEHELLAPDVLRLRLSTDKAFPYRAGQYVTVWGEDNVGRSYSLASVPELDAYLELHVRLIPDGRLSAWLHKRVKVGATLQLQTAVGNCFYLPGEPGQNLLLVGTGTGLSPLIGIARDALRQGHQGDIHLIHGAVRGDGLYLHETLENLAESHANFHYHASVLDEDSAPASAETGSIEELALRRAPHPQAWRIFLCGAPDMVNTLKKKLFLAGASMGNIYADPFLSAPRT